MKNQFLKMLLICISILLVEKTFSQNKIAVKQVKLNGANFIYFNENNNKKILENGIIDNLNKIDSAALLKFMINITEEYPNYHIPTSEELSIRNNDNYVIPEIEIKKTCAKTTRCNSIEIDDISAMFSIINDQFSTGEKNHPHLCSNCKNWGDEYRKKVPCHSCKDKRISYCGKIIKCLRCDGKGYTTSIKQYAKTLSLVEFIKSNSPTVFEYSYYSNILYFNSPTDFGIYNLSENIKKKFGSYTNGHSSYNEENQQSDISFILKEGGKTTKNIISEYYNNIKLHDEKLVSDIKKSINDNQIENAAFLYGDIINVPNYNDLKIIIHNALKEKYKNETVKLSDWAVESFIKKYSNDLINITDGKHIIKVDNIGNIFLDGILKNYKKESQTNNSINENISSGGGAIGRGGKLTSNDYYINSPNKTFGQEKNYYDFIIPTNGQAEIQIKTDTSAIAGAEIRKQTFDGCKIHKNIFGKPFRYKFLKGSWIGAFIFGSEKTESNSKLLKKDLIHVKKSNVKKYANSFLINNSEIDIVQKQEKLHNRIPKVIWRSTILTFGAFWIGLRSYEFSKIN